MIRKALFITLVMNRFPAPVLTDRFKGSGFNLLNSVRAKARRSSPADIHSVLIKLPRMTGSVKTRPERESHCFSDTFFRIFLDVGGIGETRERFLPAPQ